jgi:bifunctional non-homologous end joining protein LigD
VRLCARGGHDLAGCCPEVCASLATLSDRHVLDGHLCVLDEAGRSDPARLRDRLRRRRRADEPVVLLAFDLLLYRGEDIRGWPLWRRKLQLQRLLTPAPDAVRYVEHVEDGRQLYARALSQRLGGIVAKRRSSVYASGERSDDWLRIAPRSLASAIPVGR